MSQEQDRMPVAWNDGYCANYTWKLLSASWLLTIMPVESQHRHSSTPAMHLYSSPATINVHS